MENDNASSSGNEYTKYIRSVDVWARQAQRISRLVFRYPLYNCRKHLYDQKQDHSIKEIEEIQSVYNCLFYDYADQGDKFIWDLLEENKVDYFQKFDDDFRELFTERLRENEEFGVELWSAMANVEWHHESDPNNTDVGRSFRAAGSLIASMLCHGDYIDWYCSGPDGIVSEFITNAMASKGWHYEVTVEPILPPEAFNTN